MKLRIVAVNDVYVLDNLPRLRTLVRHYAETDPADALLVTLAGDFLSPSILSSLDAGRAMVDCLNEVGVTHVTYGNHEDDLTSEELLSRIHELRATWLSTNVRKLDPALPASQVIDVAGIKIGLLGVVMNDPSVYRRAPFGGEKMEAPNTAALAETERLLRHEHCAFVIPLTHQFADADRELAAAQQSPPYPVIIGGHEHQGVLEQASGTWIVKAKSDAFSVGIVDIVSEAGVIKTTVRLEAIDTYAPDAALAERVATHMKRVEELDHATLFALPEGQTLSSVGSRAHQTSMGTLLASRIRDALGAEVSFFNGGGIRASREYSEYFTYGALKSEVPFDNEIVCMRMPGRVIAEAIAFSRQLAPLESGGFLQVDDRTVVEQPSNVVTTIAGKPFDPDREYDIALVRNFLLGLDNITPLVRFAQENPDRVPKEDSGRDVRLVLATAFSVQLWKQLGGFDAVDANGDGQVTPSEVSAALSRLAGQKRPDITAGLIVNALDTNRDLVISRDEADAVE